MVRRSNDARGRRWLTMALLVAVTGVLGVLAAPRGADAAPLLPRGSTYVALGSSYAAGPGILPVVDARCLRSGKNYPHQIAEMRGLHLVDVTCSGATTSDILSGRQIKAVTSDARLVTVTIGGNDLGYIGQLTAQSCGNVLARALPGTGPVAAALTSSACRPKLAGRRTVSAPTSFGQVRDSLIRVVSAIRERAPQARIVLVGYLPVLDQNAATCATVPLRPEQATEAVRTYNGLVVATAAAAQATGVDMVPASTGHTRCSRDPWVAGFELGNPFAGGPIPYHPNLAGATAIARSVDDLLGG